MRKSNLEFRLLLIRAITAPSILSQNKQNFNWVIIVEPDLPSEIEGPLRDLCHQHECITIHQLDDQDNLANHKWLKPYIPDDTTHLITSLIDDDDALPSNFVSECQSTATDWASTSDLPYTFAGTNQVIQWDMDFNSEHPLGTHSPKWHRKKVTIVSAGFTMISKYPEVPLYILSAEHSKAIHYFNPQGVPRPDHPNYIWFPKQTRRIFRKLGLSEDRMEEIKVLQLGHDLEPVLMTNHGSNVQINRIYESKGRHHQVTDGQLFGDIRVDWSAINQNRSKFVTKEWAVAMASKSPPWTRPVDARFPKTLILRTYWMLLYFLGGKRLYGRMTFSPKFKSRQSALARTKEL